MPNWCANDLTITGSKESLQAFVKQHIIEKEFDFNTIIPMPEHQPDTTKPNLFFAEGGLGMDQRMLYGRNNWYDWSNENWGTKWNSSDTYYQLSDDELFLTFNTAWSPVVDLICKLAELHPDLEIMYKYIEEGMAFAGEAFYIDGQLDYESEYDSEEYLLFAYRRYSDWYLENPESYDHLLHIFEDAGEVEMVEAILEARKLKEEETI